MAGLVLMTVMQGAGDIQVTLQLVLTRLQGGDAPASEFIQEMHSGHVGEIGGLAGTEPACVKELHRHRHACFARKLVFGNVWGAEKRFGVWDAQSLHDWSVWHQKDGGKVEIGTFHLWWVVRHPPW